MRVEEKGKNLEVNLNSYFLPVVKDYETGELVKKQHIPYNVIQKFVKGPGAILVQQQIMENAGAWFKRKQFWDYEWKDKVQELEKILKKESEEDIKSFKEKKGKKKLYLNLDVYGGDKTSLIETDLQSILVEKEMGFDISTHTYSKLYDAMLVASAALVAYLPIDMTIGAGGLLQAIPAIMSSPANSTSVFATLFFKFFIDYFIFFRMGKQNLKAGLTARKTSKSKIKSIERLESLIANKNVKIGENQGIVSQINEINNYFNTLEGSLDEVYFKTALKAIDLYKSAENEELKKSARDIAGFYLGMTNKMISSFQENIRKGLYFDMPVTKGIEEVLDVETIKDKDEIKIIFPCYLVPSKDRHELITGEISDAKPNQFLSALIATGNLIKRGYKIKPVVEIRSGLDLNDNALDYIKNNMFIGIFHRNLAAAKSHPLSLSEYTRLNWNMTKKTFLSSALLGGFFMYWIASSAFTSGDPSAIATGVYLVSTFCTLMGISPALMWKMNKSVKKYSNGALRGLDKMSKKFYDGNFEITSTKLPEFSKIEDISEKYQGGLKIDEFLKKMRKEYKEHHKLFKELMYKSKKMEMNDSVIGSYLMKDRWLQQSLSEPTYGVAIDNEKLKELLE